MRKLLTATALGAMLSAGVAVAMQAEAPKAPQTKAQMLARADARFDALDTNKDGQLSAEERKAGMERARAAMAQRRGGEMGERMLARIDTNGDGMISRAENRAAAEARFARMDADKDGTIEAGERGWSKRMRGGRDGERMGMRGPDWRGPEGRGPRGGGLMMADTNKDGAISRAEFDAASAQRFARLDTNKDGKIDAADRPQRPVAPPPPAPPAPPAGK